LKNIGFNRIDGVCFISKAQELGKSGLTKNVEVKADLIFNERV